MNGQQKYMIPSLAMMNCFLKVKYKENAVQLHPVLGFSTPTDIELSGRINRRDFAIRFPDIFLPEEDGLQKLEGFDFSYHDFFHATIASCASPTTRKLFIQSAQCLSSSKYGTSYLDKKNISHLYQRLIDMEFFFHYLDIFMEKDRPEWQCFLEEILFPISKSEVSDSLLLSILKEIFQTAFKTLEERESVKTWISQMDDHLGSYISKVEQEIHYLDEKIEILYKDQKELKQKFQENPDEITRKLALVNQEISTLENKQCLYSKISELIKKEYDLSVDNRHIFQKFLKTLPPQLN